ncbi:hypothetical protein ACWFQ8_20700 [Streptomyces sp. NPDC055254]
MGGREYTRRGRQGRPSFPHAVLLLALGVLAGALLLCARPGEAHHGPAGGSARTATGATGGAAAGATGGAAAGAAGGAATFAAGGAAVGATGGAAVGATAGSATGPTAAATPGARTPRDAAPGARTPRAATPGAVTPRAAAPRAPRGPGHGPHGAAHAVCASPYDPPGCSPLVHVTPGVLPVPPPAATLAGGEPVPLAAADVTGSVRPPRPLARAPDLHALQVLRT